MAKTFKEKNSINKNLAIILFRLISLFIILICLYFLYNWHIENKENNEIITDIRAQIIIPDTISISSTDEETLPNDVSDELVDFSNLLSINPETVAWLRVNNTAVDFPVVKSQDNDYYLNHNFYNKYNSAGWIYADFRNKFDGTDKNIIIYGHNRRDGSMFSTLKNTLEESWYTNPENLQIPLYTPVGNYTYQIFSIYAIVAQYFENTVNFESDENFQSYIDDVKAKSVTNFNVDVSASDSILTLYTCGNNTKYRVIIHAKRIVD